MSQTTDSNGNADQPLNIVETSKGRDIEEIEVYEEIRNICGKLSQALFTVLTGLEAIKEEIRS